MLQRAWNLAGGAVATVVGGVNDFADLLGAAWSGATSVSPGRAHVRIRSVGADPAAPRRLERLLRGPDAVRRVEVNLVLGDVLVEFDPTRLSASEVVKLVRQAERESGLVTAAPARQGHPGSPVRAVREAALFGLNTAGLVYTTMGRALGVPTLPVALPAAALGLVDAAPRLRAAVAAAVGEPAADTLLGTAASATNAIGQRPLGLLVDGCQRFLLYREAQASRRAWAVWDADLADLDGAHRATAPSAGPRPAPLRRGPVEKTADRTALVAVAGAIGLTAVTGSTLPAAPALTVGVARAARAGREGFAAQLGRDAATRGSLFLDPAALRRLDRVDTIVLDADVLHAGRMGIDEVVPLVDAQDVELSDLVERAYDLVDLDRPQQRRAQAGWSIEPVGPAVPERAREAATRLARHSSSLLLLRRGAAPIALVGISQLLDPYAEAIVAAAAEAGLVLIAGPPQLARRLDTDGAVPGGAELADSVRRLQASGHVVALVSERADGALTAADVTIGMVRPGHAPPWSADVLTRTAGEVCLLLNAVSPARQVSGWSGKLSIAGSGIGALLAVLGPPIGAAARASIAVQSAALFALGLGVWSAITVGSRPEPVAADRTPWHAMPTRVVLESLGTSREGLPDTEARRRRHEQPAPAAPDEVGLVRASAEELANPITPTLGAGAGVSAATGSIIDPILIIAVLAVNALIGGVQRVGAQKSLRSLLRTNATRVQARRGAAGVELRAADLVQGDVIELQAGDAVPADCRVLSGWDLEVDESTLTGESVPAAKSEQATSAPALADRHSMLYEGTTVATGRGEVVVVATGNRTEVGRTLHQQGGEPPPTGVEIRLRKLTAQILPISVGAGLALVAVDLLRRRPAGAALSRGVGLAVAAVPEGLPFVATVAELAAAKRLSTRGALVRNPSTIEALGRVDMLCFDKTGTLTEGRISLRQVSDGTDTATIDRPLPSTLRDVVAAAVRASPFQADPQQVTHQTDQAVLRGAESLGITAENGHAFVDPLDELPFESNRGYHATLWRGRSGARISLKGAPEVVLPLCSTRRREGNTVPLDDAGRAAIDAEVHRLARQGHRVLAVAQRRLRDRPRLTEDDVTELEFRGLVALVDPVRPTAERAVATLRAAGVEVAMITGDHPSTAESIATELNAINGRTVLTGTELDQLTDDRLIDALPRTAVFARVTPAQKSRIVHLLQQRGLVVAVTGDGTNDAPAIRLADVGLALGTRATPAAREAADVVITDDRIETIADAIVEGRGMWTSVRDALSILLGGNLGEIAYTLGTGLIGGGSLNARQLLLINLLTDILPAMAVAVRPPPGATAATLLAEGPERSLGASLTTDIQVRAAITAATAMAAWLFARPISTPGQASTTGLVALVGAQLGQTLAVRGRTPRVAAAVLGSMALLVAVVQVPGLSHVVGSRPLLPQQWAIALTAAGAATVVQFLAQRVLQSR